MIKLHAEKTALKDENERLLRKVREMKDSGERLIGKVSRIDPSFDISRNGGSW